MNATGQRLACMTSSFPSANYVLCGLPIAPMDGTSAAVPVLPLAAGLLATTVTRTGYTEVSAAAIGGLQGMKLFGLLGMSAGDRGGDQWAGEGVGAGAARVRWVA